MLLQLRHDKGRLQPPVSADDDQLPPVEPARPADAGAIAWLLRRCAPTCLPVPAERIAAAIDRYRVARIGSRVVASAAMQPLDDDGRRCELRSVVVDPRLGHLGLGRRVVGAITAESRRAGARLYCVTSQPRFFSRLGFAPVAAERVPEKKERRRWPLAKPRHTMVWRNGDPAVEEEIDARAERRIA